MSIERIGVGPRMSQAVVHGDTIYLAGQVADKAAGKSVSEQTKEILAAIDRLLAEAGSDKTQILSATIYLADVATFAEMNAVWDGWVADGHTPARATVEAKLAAPAYRVEIACIAAKPSNRTTST
ncbi:MAG: RidA family protein [Roseiarcus sp.]|jgi:enamine deaminase RidA (YjgF/YER057c/UK114 family)